MLDERLTEIGYETVMSAGLSLSRALLEHSPQFSGLPEYERARVLDQLQADHAFAFQKYDNAFPNLLATVKRASMCPPDHELCRLLPPTADLRFPPPHSARDERQGTVCDTHPTPLPFPAAPLMLITPFAHSSTP